ncbi:hypothetical protein BKA67DRAFT_658618 [Truncatella angustata]|uniref:Uncharacterized protein n=1 Tax=Truncatella angustata TaxID=152316 RepID=A0A9P8ULD5_9PEZI|nr:uncharacterized protein BKA67DRAFT_658618 [Truncatella angustata]KAH6654313.1 hypothetical protein BKA67DRAFT_658618 [Truncatella angustata]
MLEMPDERLEELLDTTVLLSSKELEALTDMPDDNEVDELLGMVTAALELVEFGDDDDENSASDVAMKDEVVPRKYELKLLRIPPDEVVELATLDCDNDAVNEYVRLELTKVVEGEALVMLANMSLEVTSEGFGIEEDNSDVEDIEPALYVN